MAQKPIISLPAAFELLSKRLPKKEAKDLLADGLSRRIVDLRSGRVTLSMPYFADNLSDKERKELSNELYSKFMSMMVEISVPAESGSDIDVGWTCEPSVGNFLLKIDYGAEDFARFEIQGAMLGLKSLNEALQRHVQANMHLRKPGRPKGSGEIDDEPILLEAHRLMTSPENRRSLNAVLTSLAFSIQGHHSTDSTARRLRRKYNKAYTIAKTQL